MTNSNNSDQANTTLFGFTLLIGLLILAFASFVGSMYVTNGEFISSTIIALAIFVLLAVFVFQLWRAKRRDENKGFTLAEGILLFLYFGVSLGAFILTAHAYNVNFALKGHVQDNATTQLNELDRMVDTYEEHVNSSTQALRTEINNIKQNVANGGSRTNAVTELKDCCVPTLDSYQELDNKESTLLKNVEEQAKKGLTNLKTTNNNFRGEKKYIIDNWDFFRINNTLEQIDNQLQQNLLALQSDYTAYDQNPTFWKDRLFEYPISSKVANELSSPTELMKAEQYNWTVPMLVTFFIHLLVLALYLFKKREGEKINIHYLP